MATLSRISSNLKHAIVYWIPSLCIMVFIFVASNRSHVQASETPLYNFIILKTLHASGYALLTLTNAYALSQMGKRNKSWLIAAVLALTYSISDEFHQQFIPTRSGSMRDIGIDLIGIISVYWLGQAGYVYTLQKNIASHLRARKT